MRGPEQVRQLDVGARFEAGTWRTVGQLLLDGRDIYFRYAPEWLTTGYNLSPLHLKWDNEPQRAGTSVFDGLLGVFADSLPEGWGRLLTDRALLRAGIAPAEASALYRLALVGDGGPGALCYRPADELVEASPRLDDLDALAADAARVLAGEAADLDALAALGGSSGGARPKILVGYDPATGKLCPDAPVLPQGYQSWIIKFRSATDRTDAAEVEQAYALMARAAGLTVAPTRLFTGRSSVRYFGTQRFDRVGASRCHFVSAAGLLHDNFRLPAIDYGHLMDAARMLTDSRAAVAGVLRVATFNVFAYNRDDHSNNFGFLADAGGNWSLAPAYDLTFAQSTHGEHSITVAGEGRRPTAAHLRELARVFDVRGAEEILEEVRAAVGQWAAFAKTVGVGVGSAAEVGRVIG